MCDRLKLMEHPNPKWLVSRYVSIDGYVVYVADASDLAISPGVHPYASYEARDPWERELTHDFATWNSLSAPNGDTFSWEVLVSSPDGLTVKLVIYND